MYSVEFTLGAETDLDNIVGYIAANDSVPKAARLYYKLKEKIQALDELPERGRLVPELKRINVLDYKEIIIKPYRIVYKIENKTVFIIAVFDGRRDIEDWIYHRILTYNK